MHRRRQSPPPDKNYYALGWIESPRGGMVEGMFSSDGVLDQFGGLQFMVDLELGLCPWPEVSSVKMMPRDELGEQVLAIHHEKVFSKSRDPNVFVGRLPDDKPRSTEF